ncbi:MAG TPA: tetratricopeptide repeat protein [Patescibacteria group bacterium]|nr:tetratricopeptide repeat protein [Patescibacteria group bacterium]
MTLSPVINDKHIFIRETQRIDEQNEIAYGYYYTNLSEAESIARQTLVDASALMYQQGMAAANRIIGICLIDKNELDEAEVFLQKAYILFRHTNNIRGEILVATNLGNVEISRNNLVGAKRYFTYALTLSEEINDTEAKGRALCGLGGVAEREEDLRQALSSYLRSLDCFQKCGVKVSQALLYNNIGLIYRRFSDYSSALEYYFKAVEIYHDTMHKSIAADLLTKIGSVYSVTGEYEKAMESFFKGLSLKKEFNLNNSIPSSLHHIALVYCKLHENEKALEYFFQALHMIEEMESEISGLSISGRAAILSGIANCYLQLKDYPKAIAYVKAGLEIAEKFNHKRHIPHLMLVAACTYNQMEMPQEALEYIQQGLHVAEEIQNKFIQAGLHQEAVFCFKKLKNSEKALEYYEKFYLLEKEVFNHEHERKIQKLTIAMEMREVLAAQETLKKRTEELEREVVQKNKELHTQALHLIQRKDRLNTVREQVKSLSPEANDTIVKVLAKINDVSRSEDEWKMFEEQFEYFHPEFIACISTKFPHLSVTEVKICCLLKVQLTTKDIANLLCLSKRTIDTHRHNIRKKLHLCPETKLEIFLNSICSS